MRSRVFAVMLTMKLHFTYQHNGSWMERYMSNELSYMHLACGAADCNEQVTQLFQLRHLSRRSRYSLTANHSSWEPMEMSEE
ncbi:hypothetical protein TNCV_2892811 [Trichonephila clavipes]|nr:hypothetical protein TNCV_2892811 [Trichonephila clavipes]